MWIVRAQWSAFQLFFQWNELKNILMSVEFLKHLTYIGNVIFSKEWMSFLEMKIKYCYKDLNNVKWNVSFIRWMFNVQCLFENNPI